MTRIGQFREESSTSEELRLTKVDSNEEEFSYVFMKSETDHSEYETPAFDKLGFLSILANSDLKFNTAKRRNSSHERRRN